MYNPSEKQKQALINMSRVLGKSEEELDFYFVDKDEFQKHWDSTSEQVKQTIKKIKSGQRFQKAVKEGKVDLRKVQQNRETRILEYYQNPENLRAKALEYYAKYLPSKNRLYQWAMNKTQNNTALCDTLVKSMILNDSLMVTPMVENLLKQGYNSYLITSKLQQKGYERDTILEVIKELEQDSEIIEQKEKEIRKKISEEYLKGRDKDSIFYHLVQKYQLKRSDFDFYFETEVEQLDSQDRVNETVKRQIETWILQNYKKDQVIKKGMNKGYSFKTILKVLAETTLSIK